MKNHNAEILIVGAGIFGLSTAIELANRKYKVAIINPDTIPHHLAGSTDISKIVRMEYGSDELYFDMAEQSIQGWRDWNRLLGEQLYHEIGFLLLMQKAIDDPAQAFELASQQMLEKKGYSTEVLDQESVKRRFPAINTDYFPFAHFNPIAGYVKSAKVLEKLAAYARSIGVDVFEGQTSKELLIQNRKMLGVKTLEGHVFTADHTILSAGAATPYLLPELQSSMKITGHPVFHTMPNNRSDLEADNLPVFAADISNTGWYGFPVDSQKGVVKMARHTNGLELNPLTDDRRITDAEVQSFRDFQKRLFPKEEQSALVYTRRCLYTDTLDGDFWIAKHPEIKDLSVATGGSGHGMKMGPVLGLVIADMLESRDNPYLARFQWRDLSTNTLQKEEARFVEGGKL